MEEQDYVENKKLIYELNDILMRLLTKEAVSEEDVEFAKHLVTYFQQVLTNSFDLGLGRRRYLPQVLWFGMEFLVQRKKSLYIDFQQLADSLT